MDNLMIEVAKQMPALAGLLFIVIRFLSHVRETEDRRAELDAKREDGILTRLTVALDRNTEALGQIQGAMQLKRISDASPNPGQRSQAV